MAKDDASLSVRKWPVVTVVALLFLVLGLRLWQLQVLRGEKYRTTSVENRLRTEKVPAPRGIIYDRNGTPLVRNSAYYSVSLLPELAGAADIEAIAEFLGITARQIMARIKKHPGPLGTIKLKEGLSFNEVARTEARLSDYPGLVIDTEQTRHYIYGKTVGHLIGYLGRINPRQARDPAYKDVPPQTFIGQWGIEKLYDDHLRGTPGRRVIEVDALGRQLRLLHEEPPVRGNDLYLSIDIELQKAAERAFKGRAGALVAFKPTTGELLGMISRPSYDPNLFSRGIVSSEWKRLLEGERFPLLNRALQSQYPPGSTFKLITAMAALEDGGLTPEETITCTGEIRRGRWTFGCWKKGGHGKISLHRAIVESCDIYFYLAGQKAGIDNIALRARQFGLGQPTGIPLVREKAGLIPDTKWKRRVKKEPWYLGETYNASIGQGFVLATPAQMARMMSAIANGGYLYKPLLTRAETQPVPISNSTVSTETLELIRNGLMGVVHEPRGTGRAARSRLTEILGKTGTAQVIALRDDKEGEVQERFRDHAWFVAYAPRENPQIALAVLVEHGGHGGSAAAPIAREAIEAYLKSMERHAEHAKDIQTAAK